MIKKYSQDNYAMNNNWLLMLRYIAHYISRMMQGTITSSYIHLIMCEFICAMKVYDNTGNRYPIVLDYQHLFDEVINHIPSWLFSKPHCVYLHDYNTSNKTLFDYLTLGYTEVTRWMCDSILNRSSALLKGVYGVTPDIFMDLNGILACEQEDFTIVIEPTWMFDMDQRKWVFHDSYSGKLGHVHTEVSGDSIVFGSTSKIPEVMNNRFPIPVDLVKDYGPGRYQIRYC